MMADRGVGNWDFRFKLRGLTFDIKVTATVARGAPKTAVIDEAEFRRLYEAGWKWGVILNRLRVHCKLPKLNESTLIRFRDQLGLPKRQGKRAAKGGGKPIMTVRRGC